MNKKICFLIIIMFVSTFSSFASEQTNLTPEQLILLMKASSEQYRTIVSDIYNNLEKTLDNGEKKQISKIEIISRWTRQKAYYEVKETVFETLSTMPEQFYKRYAIQPNFSKSLEIQNGRTPRSKIYQTYRIEHELPFYGLYQAMWGLGGWPWEQINLDSSTISFEEKSGCYIFTLKMGINPKGSSIKLYVDPNKNYIPVRQDSLNSDGTCFAQYYCLDLRETNGLWVPFEYTWFYPEYKTFGKNTVKNLIVNQPIPSEQLDLEFPEGTIVDDERLGTTYRITKKQSSTPITDTNQPTDVNMKGVLLGKTATDEELRTAAAKARELLATAGIEKKQIKKIGVFPGFVYVKPEKSEYIISVKSTDANKPQLLSQSFESDKMKLVSLQNQISDKGELIANIQRQAGDSGFEKGTLTLQFKEQKVEIIFVSPPIR